MLDPLSTAAREGTRRSSLAASCCYQGAGAGGATTGGRSSQVIVFGSCHDPNHGPVVPPPSLPPRSTEDHSDPVGRKWNDPQLLMPTAPTLRASTFSNVADP